MCFEGFTKATDAALRKSGWNPALSRKVEGHIQALERDGYVVPAVVRDFLQSFADLSFERRVTWRVTDWFDFNAARAAGGVEPDFVHERETQLATDRLQRVPLCPIGEADSGSSTLLMDERGAVYVTSGNALLLVGTSPTLAIETLFAGSGRSRVVPAKAAERTTVGEAATRSAIKPATAVTATVAFATMIGGGTPSPSVNVNAKRVPAAVSTAFETVSS